MLKNSYECTNIINKILKDISLYKDLDKKCLILKPKDASFFTNYLLAESEIKSKLTYVDKEYKEVTLFQALVIFTKQNSILERGEIAYKLIAVRNIGGLSQGKLAKKLNIDIRNYSKWETGERSPKIESLQKIFQACDVNFKHYFD